MKAYLANGTVSLLASPNAIAVTLDDSIASAIYDYESLSPEQLETIAEGQAAERLRLNWDVLAAFSKANPTCDKSALLAFQA